MLLRKSLKSFKSALIFIFQPYRGIFKSLSEYWNAYGGFASFLRSPYLHFSILTATILFLNSETPQLLLKKITDVSLSILPSLLGFTIAGMAIFISSQDIEFKKIISSHSEKEKNSIFVIMSATFAHFTIMNILSLLNATLAKVIMPTSSVYIFLSTVLFIYSLTLSFATVLALMRIAKWSNFYCMTLNIEEREQLEEEEGSTEEN